MSIFTLIAKEIAYRRTHFILTVLAVAMAATAILVSIALLKSTDLETDAVIGAKLHQTEKEMARLEDNIRKSMKGLGFNIYIFPENQDLSEVYDQGYASRVMPEEYVTRLATSRIVTVNHLLPSLTQKTVWPEYKRTIILIGIRGEEPIAHSDPMSPLINPVKPGNIVLGFELHQSLGLKSGDTVRLMGQSFKVEKCHEARGSADDITAWINLSECQELLKMPGLINSIMALECNCETADRLADVRRELHAILPGTRIVEKGSEALARAEARVAAQKAAEQQVAAIKLQRAELQKKREALAAVLVPLIGVLCLAGICLLTFLNAKDRTPEIGILAAIGLRSNVILLAFMLKSILTGVAGGLIGIALALVLIAAGRVEFFAGYGPKMLISSAEVMVIAGSMPLFSAAAAWLPSFWGAKQDPAEVLRNE